MAISTVTGTYTWANGDVYTGAWVDGARTGEGTFTWSDGDVYTGAFVDGAITGRYVILGLTAMFTRAHG